MAFLGVNFSVHREGFKFVGILTAITFLFLFISLAFAWFFLLLTLFCAFFFRNPKRAVPIDNNLVVSPCDGIVCSANLESPAAELGIGEEERYKVSIFLSIFNVHINRTPVAGRIKKVIYQPGAFLNAALDKSSSFNEKNSLIMEINGDQKKLIAFTQIAGVVARRIICDVHEGQEIGKGEIFGLIRFGSRCDVWLPVGVVPKVSKSQTTIGGETIIADLSAKDSKSPECFII